MLRSGRFERKKNVHSCFCEKSHKGVGHRRILQLNELGGKPTDKAATHYNPPVWGWGERVFSPHVLPKKSVRIELFGPGETTFFFE